MNQLSASRLEVAKAIHSMTVDTPLYKSAGELSPDGSDSTSSYAAVHVTLNKKCQLYLNKYPEHILHYAIEWERILTTRITEWLRQSEKLRVDLDHYQNKVEDLNQSVNKAQNKGKNVNDKDIDKLKRNEGKYVQSRQDYDKFVNNLCGYMEEVLERGWKDLHPMLVKMAQFDSTFSNDEAAVLKSINGVTHELMAFGTKNDLMPQGRLKELETSSPEALIQKYHPSGTTLTIMGGEVGGGFSNSPLNSADELPVGGGGGLFGTMPRKNSGENFASSNGGSLQSSRNNSEVFAPRSRTNTGDSDWNSSRGATPTDFSYAPNLASAPAPTLEDVFGSPGGAVNASAGMPPPPPSMPPPLPPQQMPNMAGLSMYDNRQSMPASMPPPMAPPPIPTANSYQVNSAPNSGGLFSPGGLSQAGSTNPFDDNGARSQTNPFG